MMKLVLPKEDALNRTGGFHSNKSDQRPPESPFRSKRNNSKGSRGSRGSRKSKVTMQSRGNKHVQGTHFDESKDLTSAGLAEDLELDLSKSEFLTEVDPDEANDHRGPTFGGFGDTFAGRPRSSRVHHYTDS